MDSNRFDQLPRKLAQRHSRRGAVRILVGSVAAAIGLSRAADRSFAQDGPRNCLEICARAYSPGFERDNCVQLGQRGEGLCYLDQIMVRPTIRDCDPDSDDDGIDTTDNDGFDTTSNDGVDTTDGDGIDTTSDDGVNTTDGDGIDTTDNDGFDTTDNDGFDTTDGDGFDTTDNDGYSTPEESDSDTDDCITPITIQPLPPATSGPQSLDDDSTSDDSGWAGTSGSATVNTGGASTWYDSPSDDSWSADSDS